MLKIPGSNDVNQSKSTLYMDSHNSHEYQCTCDFQVIISKTINMYASISRYSSYRIFKIKDLFILKNIHSLGGNYALRIISHINPYNIGYANLFYIRFVINDG
jgi:mRNA-degrading endonuclease HigB of HigAB toxin-antitoxin module